MMLLDQADLFGNIPARKYPHTPGAKGCGPTLQASQEAADAIAGKAGSVRRQCLELIRGLRDATSDEIAARLGRPEVFIRPRISELGKLGLIEPTGTRRKNKLSDCTATVWRAAR